MAIRNNKALGRGINALFQQGEKKADEPKAQDGVEKNHEFYGSLMKKYVQSGSSDPVIGQMLEEIREHLCITPEDHLQLLNTLKKREEARLDRATKDNWSKAQGALKSELGRMFDDYKIQSLKEFDAIEGEEAVRPDQPIALNERNPTIVRESSAAVISAPPAKPGAAPSHPAPGTEVMSESECAPKRALEEPLRDNALDLLPLMEDGKFAEALQMVQGLLEKDPYSVSLLNEKGVILYNMDRSESAIQAFNRGLSIEPDSAELNINCALAMAESGQLQGSIELLDRAIGKDPYNEEAWNNKAVILSRIGKLRDALMCLDESLRLNERSFVAWTNAAVLLERMGEYGPAYESYGKVLELDPDDEHAKKGRDYCRVRLGA